MQAKKINDKIKYKPSYYKIIQCCDIKSGQIHIQTHIGKEGTQTDQKGTVKKMVPTLSKSV